MAANIMKARIAHIGTRVRFIKYTPPYPTRQQFFGTDSAPEPVSTPNNSVSEEGNSDTVQNHLVSPYLHYQ